MGEHRDMSFLFPNVFFIFPLGLPCGDDARLTASALPAKRISTLSPTSCLQLYLRDLFAPLEHNTTEMFSYKRQTLEFTLCFLVSTLVNCIRKCGQDICRDDQVCCAQGNNTAAVTCCRQIVDNTYYSIAMVTRKLSGVLILLLLFALGYFVQRMVCSRTRQLTPADTGHPAATVSQEELMGSCTSDSLVYPARTVQLPSYEESKHLPTYEETVRSGCRAPPGSTPGQTTSGRWLHGQKVLVSANT